MRSQEQRLDRPNLSTSIQDILRDKIFSGELKPGDKIVEEKWADLLGVSKTPLKMSFVGLAEEGLVELVPRRGAFVKELSVKDELEIYQIRETLEKLAISLAVESDHDELLEELTEAAQTYAQKYRLFADLTEELKNGSRGRRLFIDLKSADIKFHRILVKMSGNAHLFELMNKGRVQYLTFIAADRIRPDLELPAEVAEEHLSIADAVSKKDVDTAEQLLERHLERGANALRDKLARSQRL